MNTKNLRFAIAAILLGSLAAGAVCAAGCGRTGGTIHLCPVSAPQAADSGPGPGAGQGKDCVAR